MSKSNYFENALLLHIFQNAAIANVGDGTGLRGSTTPGSLYIALHTADPGEAGASQTVSECAYTGYARVALTRDSTGFTVTGNSVSPTSTVSFPAATAGAETATYWSVGVAGSGSSDILYSGPLSPSIAISAGTTPQLTTASTITED